MPPSSRPEGPPDGPAATAGFLAFALPRLAPSGLRLRPAVEGDLALLAAIYATTREEELRQVAWSAEQKRAFTDWQSRQQERHYALHYPQFERLLVEREEPIGRIYVDTASEIRVMEITLLPPFRNQGTGTSLMNLVLAYADALGRPTSLHVEPFNPAKRMYRRMGFDVVEARGVYEYLVRPVPRG